MNFIQDRQIVDETGLTGRFNFALLVRKKSPQEVIVIDHLDKPSAS
jgi:hypothetical protein